MNKVHSQYNIPQYSEFRDIVEIPRFARGNYELY